MATYAADSAAAIDITSDKVINVADGVTVTLSGVLSGTGPLQKTGTGTVILTGENTYTGGTTLTAGILSVSADSALGEAPTTATAGHLGLGGGTLQVTGSTDVELNANRGINVTSDSTLDILVNDGSRGGSLTYSGIIAGTTGSDLTLNNSAPTSKGVTYLPSLILNGVNTAPGALVVAEGNNAELINTVDADGNAVIATWAGPVTLSGDLKGNGTVGAVTSTGGRLSPGTTVGSGMTLASLTADVDTQFYFGFDNAGADTLTVTGTATLTTSASPVAGPEIVVVPYVATADANTRILIDAATLAVTTASSVTNTTFAGYADGNEDVTDGTFAKTLTFNADTTNGHYEMVIPA